MKKIILWIVGGVLLTAAAFFIPEQSGSVWPSVFASSIVAFLYLIAFAAIWIKEIKLSHKRKFIGVSLTILLVFSAFSALLSYESSIQKKEHLATIKTHIETRLMENFIREPLTKTLAGFYDTEYNSSDVGEIFRNRYDSLITGDSVFTFGSRNENQSISIYLAVASPDSVVLIGESSYIDGNDADFSNYSGEHGRYQVRGILTSKGIRYERRN